MFSLAKSCDFCISDDVSHVFKQEHDGCH